MTTTRAVGSQVITGGGEALQGLAVLRILRLTRVVRVFKMSRNFQGLVLLLTTFQARRPAASSRRAVPSPPRLGAQRSASALLMLVFFVAMSLIVFATLIFHAEQARSRRFRIIVRL